jgi:hypothetical protein
MRFIFSLLIWSILLSSCGSVPCGPAELNFRIIGISNTETDTMIIRKLKKNSTEIVSRVEYNPSNPVQFVHFSDTAIMVAYPSDVLMRSNYDYEIEFPSANRTFRITDIKEMISYTNSHSIFSNTKEYCMNTISSCQIDGVLVTVLQFPNTLYLRK